MLIDYDKLIGHKLDEMNNSGDIGVVAESASLAEQIFNSRGLVFKEIASNTAYIKEDKLGLISRLRGKKIKRYLCYVGKPVGIYDIEFIKFPLAILWFSVASNADILRAREAVR